jgi:hypothetical protein
MTEARKVLQFEDQAPDHSQGGLACRHHWLIETPHGPACKGVCKLCGTEREFQSSSEDHDWSLQAGATAITEDASWRVRQLAGLAS